MKFDQETLLKNRFWVLLCVAVPLTLIAMVFLVFIVPGQTATLKKKNDDEHSKLKKFGILANQKWIEQAEKGLEKAKKEEKNVWEKAWLAQENLYSWPGELNKTFKDGCFIKDIKIHPADAKPEALTPPEVKAGYYRVLHGIIQGAAGDNQSIKVVALKPSKSLPDTDFYNPGPNQGKIVVAGKEAEKKKFEELQNYLKHKAVITYEKGKAFGDDLTEEEQREFSKEYLKQIVPVLRELGPLNELKEPVVQFKAGKDATWSYSENPKELFFQEPAGGDNPPVARPTGANRGVYEFFPYVPPIWKDLLKFGTDSTKDAWTFQENLWVMRELFRQLRTVNDDIAAFRLKKTSGGAEPTFIFENPYWQLELKPLPESKLHVKISNLTDSRQKIPTGFKVKFAKDKNAKFIKLPRFDSPPLAARGVVPEKDGTKIKDWFEQEFNLSDELRGESPKVVVAVEQILNWETAGVKRIDAVHIGTPQAQSHRTVNRPLKSFFPEKKEEKKLEDPGDVKKKDVVLDEIKLTSNGMVLERYLDVTPQSRRLPVALAVIVDQDQVYRVQAALAACNFRFLTTQVVVNRCPESMRPIKRSTPGQPGVDPQPPPVEEPTPGANQQETNVELVIYGVITLYERYPERPKTTP